MYGQSVCPVLALLAALPDVKERERLRGISIVWSAVIAAADIAQFLRDTAAGVPGRIGGIFGNANVMGIFLVISWFALADFGERQDPKSRFRLLLYAEPLFLYAAALTLPWEAMRRWRQESLWLLYAADGKNSCLLWQKQ
ncbi:MAG: hypothetical protein ACLTTZ_02000 [Lachnospiraceae bacterium]